MSRGLRTQVTMTIALIVLVTIVLISILSNIFINNEFENYAKEQQKVRTQDLIDNLSYHYNGQTKQWDVDYVHGVGMYAMYDGYIIRLYDRNGKVVWDAENHDMTLCHQIIDEITERMDKKRPDLEGGFVSREYDLSQGGQTVGKVAITYYGPYFLSENDVHFLNALNLVLLIVGVLALLSSLIIGVLLAKRISRPIIKTAHIAAQIANGSYDIRFEGKTRTRELDELAGAVNHMAASLNRQEHLRKRLITDVAHELRTPLTAVASYLEAMIDGVWKPSPERLKSCYEEIGRISGLVADMERLAQVESDNLKLTKTSVDLLELVGTVAHNFESESAKKNITVETNGVSCVVQADGGRLNQVVVNLLSNAIKYTPENGRVRITVEDSPGYGLIKVEDNGIGIPPDELPLIFERFYRTDKSRSRKTGGAGIGLTIAKSIVNAHGGEIKAESEADHGSCFTVILPKVNDEA